jgi:hypothetical protein
VPRATPELITKRGKVQINETGQTSLDNVYAGGDLVRGGSTVILAMYDGRKAAESIDRMLREQYHLDQGPATIPARSGATIPADFRILRKRMLTPDIAWKCARPRLPRTGSRGSSSLSGQRRRASASR